MTGYIGRAAEVITLQKFCFLTVRIPLHNRVSNTRLRKRSKVFLAHCVYFFFDMDILT